MSEILIRNCKSVYELSKVETCSEELKRAIDRMYSYVESNPSIARGGSANSFTGSLFPQGSLFCFTAEGQELKKPKTLLLHILHDIIIADEISERDYEYNSFRQRISEIRRALLDKGVILKSQWYEYKNGNGNSAKYKKHFIYSVDKAKAAEVYRELWEKSRSKDK